jgi:hypothetical protein
MYVMIAIYMSITQSFSGLSAGQMIVDKTQFTFESDCKRAVEILEAKWSQKTEQSGTFKPAFVSATCIYVR